MEEHMLPLTVLTEGLPAFRVGQPQQVDVEVSGGTPPYQFEITEGALPAGLTFSPNGQLSGTVAGPADDVTIFVQVTDAAGNHLTQAYDLEVTSG